MKKVVTYCTALLFLSLLMNVSVETNEDSIMPSIGFFKKAYAVSAVEEDQVIHEICASTSACGDDPSGMPLNTLESDTTGNKCCQASSVNRGCKKSGEIS